MSRAQNGARHTVNLSLVEQGLGSALPQVACRTLSSPNKQNALSEGTLALNVLALPNLSGYAAEATASGLPSVLCLGR